MSSFFKVYANATIPKSHIIDIGMVDVRYLKIYNSHYADNGSVGKLMYHAQKECFDHRNMGVCVTKNFSDQLKGTSVTQYPILGKNKSPKD